MLLFGFVFCMPAEKVIHSQIEWVHCSRFHDLHTNTKSTFYFAVAAAVAAKRIVQQIIASNARILAPKWNCITFKIFMHTF